MVNEIIPYTDYNGNQRTETFNFNFTDAEIHEMEYSAEGGFGERLQRIVEAKDNVQLVKEFKGIILKSFGVKSDDGKRFVKSEELSTAFSQTEAYNILYNKLISDSEFAANFINGIMPKKASDNLAKNIQVVSSNSGQKPEIIQGNFNQQTTAVPQPAMLAPEIIQQPAMSTPEVNQQLLQEVGQYGSTMMPTHDLVQQ